MAARSANVGLKIREFEWRPLVVWPLSVSAASNQSASSQSAGNLSVGSLSVGSCADGDGGDESSSRRKGLKTPSPSSHQFGVTHDKVRLVGGSVFKSELVQGRVHARPDRFDKRLFECPQPQKQFPMLVFATRRIELANFFRSEISAC
ncbi:hypothetical protein CA85_06520 [Allorhodopirellula solitaria]|uniref:Uncharacterized protein n=1 Tax=Allorhodopirellula solitaria TaxID=2527987 RepID=A0A5C5YKI0_9BACT|nr:hypothetical protein CA85_06520 [Allorhodopirellula solitaria]